MSRLSKESSFLNIPSTSRKGHEGKVPSLSSSRILRVTLLSSEWRSTKMGGTTFNRELAIQLAKFPDVEVSVYLPECNEEDKRVAASHNVHLIEAEKLHGFDPLSWLSSLPAHHAVDCVISHGVQLGRQAQLIKRQHLCKWIQVVHTDPEELGMFKKDADTLCKREKMHNLEVLLCELSDQVVAVGPKLAEAFSGYLRPFQKDQNVLNLTPGIFSEFANVQQASKERRIFSGLLLGNSDSEDLQLKGYDIAAQAIAELKDMPQPYKLQVVGVRSEKEQQVAEMLLQQGFFLDLLVVRGFREREQLAEQFCEVDLAIIPSTSEGFGLPALEALSAGIPVLVSGNSGLGEALKNVPHGLNCVVDSDNPKEWAKAIRSVHQKRRALRLAETKFISEEYGRVYSWEEQCRLLVQRMMNITSDRVPSYVRAGGPKLLAAYNRALETGGATYDKRVKVLLIGQDRVGKTSLGKNLRGLAFNKNERSTNGVEMIPAVKNAGTGPWRNPDALEHTTVYDYNITVSMLTEQLLTTPAEQSTTEQLSQEQIQELSSVGGTTLHPTQSSVPGIKETQAEFYDESEDSQMETTRRNHLESYGSKEDTAKT